MIQPAKFQYFVYLGVGDDSACLENLDTQSDCSIFIEADSELIDTWNLASLEKKNIKIINKAVVTEFDTSTEFKRFNLEDFNGFYESDELTKLYPGLKLREHVAVTSILFDKIFDKIPEYSNTFLAIDIPLQSDYLLKSFLANKLYQKVTKLKFSFLSSFGGLDAEVIYERITQMEDVGYVLTSTVQKNDFTHITFQKNKKMSELLDSVLSSNKALQKLRVDADINNESQNKKNALLLKKSISKGQKLNAATKALDDSKTQMKSLIKERDKARDSRDIEKIISEELKLKLTIASKTLDTEITYLQTQLTTALNALEHTNIQMETVTEELDKARDNNDAEKVTNEELTIASKTLDTEITDLQTQLTMALNALEHTNIQMKTVTEELDKARDNNDAEKVTNEELTTASKELHKEVIDFRMQLADIQKESKTSHDLYGKQIKSLTVDRTSIANELKNQTQLLVSSQVSLDKLNVKIQSLTEECTQERKLKEAEKAINDTVVQASKALQSEMTDLIAQFEHKDREYKTINIEQLENIKKGNAELENVRAERDSGRKERNSTREVLEQKKIQLDKLSQQLNDAQRQVNIVKIENNTIKQQKFEYLAQQKLLETQLINAEAHLNIITEFLIKPKNNGK
jgi:chromosome segregation ATPase